MSRRKASSSSPLLFALARLAVALASRLPLSWARGAGAAFGRLANVLPNSLRRVTRINLDRCFPELSPAKRRRLAKRSLVQTGRTFGESGALLRWPVERLKRLEQGVEGEELLTAAMARGKGVLLLLPHLGNWEYFAPFLAGRHEAIALYRPPRLVELEGFVRAARERTGLELAPANPSGLRRLAHALRDGRIVLVLPDQEPVRASGVFAPFFGVPALTGTLVARLQRRFGSPALFAWAERTRGGFTVRFQEAPEGLGDQDPRLAARRLNEGVEACVNACPEQYLWSYKRFKSRPWGGWLVYDRRPPIELSFEG